MNASLGIICRLNLKLFAKNCIFFARGFLDSLKFRYLCFFNPVLFTSTTHNVIKLSANCQDRSKQSLK